MGRQPTEIDRLTRLTAALEGVLSALNRRALAASAQPARGRLPGPFLSQRPAARGMEPAPPRLFQPDDEPDRIDMGRIGPAFAANPAWAALNGELRSRHSTSYLESEFIVVIDLSRSLLSGCRLDVADQSLDPKASSAGKLGALYFGVAAFLAVAESAGFVLRAVYAQGNRAHQDRSRTPRDFRARVLAAMSDHLGRTARTALADPSSTEPFSLAAGLATVRSVGVRSVIAVISDFLDPLGQDERPPKSPKYTHALADLMARHDVLLVDVASPDDLKFPEPGLFNRESRRLDSREWARHLEWGTEPRPLSRAEVRDWNTRRKSDREELTRVVRAVGGRLENIWGWNYSRSHALAQAHLGVLR
jgi:hypothetical protein